MKRIDEVSYADLTPLGAVMKRHLGQGRFIHFSRVKKMGIKPPTITKARSHSDPMGVYFYDLDWLWNHEDFHDHQQWATDFPYFFIVELDRSTPGINLPSITEDEIRALAERNGWLEFYDNYTPWKLSKCPGDKMWSALQSLDGADNWRRMGVPQSEDAKSLSWDKALKGIGWINDTSGIIHPNEPHQLCVRDPRAMRLVESGTQPVIKMNSWEGFDYWRHALTGVYASLQAKYDGEVNWKNKRPTFVASGDSWEVRVIFKEGMYSGLTVYVRTGRAVSDAFISTRKMKDMSLGKLAATLSRYIRLARDFDGEDLQFTPTISADAAHAMFLQYFVQGDYVKPEWEIMNQHKFMRLESGRTRGKTPVKSNFALNISDDKITVNCGIEVNGTRVMALNGADPATFEEAFWKSLDTYAKQVSAFHPESDHYLRFDENEWPAFLGYLGATTGLRIFEKYESSFSAFPNRKELYGQIERVFSRVGW